MATRADSTIQAATVRPRGAAVRKWMWRRLWQPPPPDDPAGLPQPALFDPAAFRSGDALVWVGHATVLLHLGGRVWLTDPVWRRRVGPLPGLGPERRTPPGVPWAALPPVDRILLSHDHYDHLDAPTLRRLARRFGPRLVVVAPPGYRRWLARRGLPRVVELAWGQAWDDPPARVRAWPAQHWTRRGPCDTNRRGWSAWGLEVAGRKVFFAGDTGYGPHLAAIGGAWGPVDVALLPIGAYAPREVMAPVHLDPEEAVRAYLDLGGRGALVPIHWGTFRLSDEPLDEPPRRLAAAWQAAGLPPERLWRLRPGEVRRLG